MANTSTVPVRPASRPQATIPIVVGLLLTACAGTQTYELPVMPAPAYLDDGAFDPFRNASALPRDGRLKIPYATLRLPADADSEGRFYSDERAQMVRLGVGHIEASDDGAFWQQLQDTDKTSSGDNQLTLMVSDVTEFGGLASTRAKLGPESAPEGADLEATNRFATAINEQLAKRNVKDIFVYVHGYRVNFENPLLVAAELWHFMGYEGVFIPFAWPSHKGRLAYFGDTESSRYSARAFREFLRFLAAETDARRIHIVGYSAGTRLVMFSMYQLALLGDELPTDELRRQLRLGNVILIGSDVDVGIASTYVQDGVLNVAEQFTFYESPADKALGISRRVLGHERVGQVLEQLVPESREFLLGLDRLAIVNVESAPFYDSGNGHGYFKDSPTVSSDLLATLLYNLPPEERGLVREPGVVAWSFPPDYIARLRRAVAAQTGAAYPSPTTLPD